MSLKWLHGADGDARRLHEGEPAHARLVGGAEARHGDGDDVFAGFAQKVEGARGDKERKRRIQPARNADDRRLAVRVL